MNADRTSSNRDACSTAEPTVSAWKIYIKESGTNFLVLKMVLKMWWCQVVVHVAQHTQMVWN